MSEKLIRIYQKCNAEEIKPHVMIYGDLAASCGNCNELNLKLSDKSCPSCGTQFQYISFRNVKSHVPKIYKIFEEHPEMKIIDYEDYKKALGDLKAQKFFQ